MRRRFLNNIKSISNDYRSEYFTIEALEDGLTASLSTNACDYRIDNGSWHLLSADTNTPSINKGQTLSFRGYLTSSMIYGIGTFTISKKCNVSGNIMSLLYGDNFKEQTHFGDRRYAFEKLFKNCTTIQSAKNLILSAAILIENCYSSMFYGCTSLTTAPELPATTLARYCYSSMFKGCTSLTTAPELPATTLANYCYNSMFNGCTSLKNAPKLPATELASGCYTQMFWDCTSLVTAPELHATTLASNCYNYMLRDCNKLNYITMLATDISASGCLNYWVYGVASSGTFVKHKDMTSLPSGGNGIPNGWTVQDYLLLTECTSLTITADDVKGDDTTTTIYYTAICNGIDSEGETVTGIVKEGTAVSAEFPQNTSETETIERTITFEFMGVTASTVITQGIWVNQSYTVDLNNQWELSSTISNPGSGLYDGVYQSFSNKGINSTAAVMYIDINGCTDFDLYIRSYAESSWDYIMVSQLDQTIDNNTSYSNSTLVKAHTRGNQKSGNTISDYTKVSFTGIDGGKHRITIVYRKDSSSHSGDDRGYVLIVKK